MEKSDIKSNLDDLYNHTDDFENQNPLKLKLWHDKLQEKLGNIIEELEIDINETKAREDGPND